MCASACLDVCGYVGVCMCLGNCVRDWMCVGVDVGVCGCGWVFVQGLCECVSGGMCVLGGEGWVCLRVTIHGYPQNQFIWRLFAWIQECVSLMPIFIQSNFVCLLVILYLLAEMSPTKYLFFFICLFHAIHLSIAAFSHKLIAVHICFSRFYVCIHVCICI